MPLLRHAATARTAWLDPADPEDQLPGLLVPAAARPASRRYPVSTAVGNVRNNGPELVEPIPARGVLL